MFPHHWRHKRAHLSFPKEVFTKYGCRKLVVALVEKKERNGVSWAGLRSHGAGHHGSGRGAGGLQVFANSS